MEKDFVAFIQKHQGIIHKVCRMYCDSEDDRQDLFQEVLFQLWKSYPKFRGDSKISTWMYRIALNTAIARLRKVKRKPSEFSLSDSTLQFPDTPSDTEKEEQLKNLQLAIQKLSKVEKGIIMLYLEEKSYDEIAEIIGITKTNVGVKINRIKKKLKETLEKLPQ
ncbi:RNA polymerase sigma factor, sigma-70 family [Bernardetia litoralis DSM 6794]|uniref:RNA polymerase sigma factor, sigma-70 family n=1 Tax=Bernardetia litoralis (strain ATCC 23117 / DSM 6794 / NBRC 15988 / NCIMB 1366 / Fx l1 / Sio-4) TaxID=880071 RepID=I4AJW5_BERLS|nr:sigma-70 family RNA polymerase sigma factor [Bernardetia litoralis]AFM04250.1 RNA polymerase sigma factor, sigma-70 family [Bernardetia litoralis DSM 6794]